MCVCISALRTVGKGGNKEQTEIPLKRSSPVPVLEVIRVVLRTVEARACLLVVGLDTSYGPC